MSIQWARSTDASMSFHVGNRYVKCFLLLLFREENSLFAFPSLRFISEVSQQKERNKCGKEMNSFVTPFWLHIFVASCLTLTEVSRTPYIKLGQRASCRLHALRTVYHHARRNSAYAALQALSLSFLAPLASINCHSLRWRHERWLAFRYSSCPSRSIDFCATAPR